jgi:hypothetical protein
MRIHENIENNYEEIEQKLESTYADYENLSYLILKLYCIYK